MLCIKILKVFCKPTLCISILSQSMNYLHHSSYKQHVQRGVELDTDELTSDHNPSQGLACWLLPQTRPWQITVFF